MKNKDKIKEFQEAVSRKIDDVHKRLVFPEIFTEATTQNKNIRNQIDKTEYKKFDEDWIVKIESFFPSLNQIINNIRNTLKYEEELLPVERTRRTSNESVRHILRNTKYIKDINDKNEVYPSKVLNTISELDYGIYENRLIMTLIDRLYHYLLRRMDAINEHIHGFKQSDVTLKNEFKIGEINYTLNFELNAKETFDSSEIDIQNKRIFERTSAAFKVVSRMYHSDFMRIMSRYKKVIPPILKTQMIQKNADFRNAYTLWLYLDKLNVLDYSLQTQIHDIKLNKKYQEQIDKSLIMLFSTIFINSNLGISIFDQEEITFKSLLPTNAEVGSYINNLNVKIPPIELESHLATEYHLDKARQLFESKKLANIQIDNNSENHNYFKQVLLDQYSIADQIFNAYFNLDQDDDVFSRLMIYKNPIKSYEEGLNKYYMTKAARQVKEKLFLDSLTLEDKWINELLSLQEEAINNLINSGNKDNLELIERMKKEVNEKLLALEKTEIDKTKNALQNQRIKNNKFIKDLKVKHAKEVRLYREAQNKRMKEEKEKISLKLALDTKRIKERETLKRKKAVEKLTKDKQLTIKKLNDTKTKTKKEIKKNVTTLLAQERNKK